MYLSTEHSDEDVAATVDAFAGAVEVVVNSCKP